MNSVIKHSFIEVNGVRLHVAEAGQGPLVLLCHGWPELWYSWKHQLSALAEAGFRVVAPDMRGYGESAAPDDIAAYTILHLVGDMVGLVAALGERDAIIIGHDWGANVAWMAALLRPDVFRAVAALSVPYRPRSPLPPLEMLRKRGLHDFYWIYFQAPGVAEAEFERDVPLTFRRLLGGIVVERDTPLILAPGKGFLDKMAEPARLPDWLSDADLTVYVDAFRRTGFRGGLNWYRNIDRNWELLAPWQGAVVRRPALFIAGSQDGVIRGPMGEKALAQLAEAVPDLQGKMLIEGAGHWIQRERPAEVNAALLDFLVRVAR